MKMDCGNYPLCGVLAIESGLGPGKYKSKHAIAHGLWPETGVYGNSQCLGGDGQERDPDENTCDPPYQGCSKEWEGCSLPFAPTGEPGFAMHEWCKHGKCAGFDDSIEYTQVLADMSNPVNRFVGSVRHLGWDGIKREVCKRFPERVWQFDDEHKQILFKTCSMGDRTWKVCPSFQKPGACDRYCHG